MRTTRWLLFGVLSLASFGCATTPAAPPTVDVTGTWVGTWKAVSLPDNGPVQLTLEQNGARVTGDLRMTGGYLKRDGAIGGSVAGDEYRITQASPPLDGYLTVKGDEMAGIVNGLAPMRFSLRRGQ